MIRSLSDEVDALNARFEGAGAADILDYVHNHWGRQIPLVSSFGAESVVLLHMAAGIDKAWPVLFLDTEMLFPATLEYQRDVTAALGLSDIRKIRPDRDELFRHDPDGDLNRRDPDLCCAIRKTRPLARALTGFSGWITGRKRFQSAGRAGLAAFEAVDGGRIKVNPLASWSREDIAAYMERHALPRHPLVSEGFRSIGCAPCTRAVREGEDDRAGRWAGQNKDECGIHFVDGRVVRKGDQHAIC